MAKSELGTKRIDPETGRKFYDLNKDPIVSPYTGNSYPRSYFESADKRGRGRGRGRGRAEGTRHRGGGAEVVSLEEADEETKGEATMCPTSRTTERSISATTTDDTFLEEEEEEDDDVADIIGVGDDEDEV